MTPLREIPHARQIPGEPPRRWFQAPGMALVIWGETTDEIVAFQLSYAKDDSERALTWKQSAGFDHSAVDDGEQTPLRNRTPILVADGELDAEHVSALFERASTDLPADIREFVLARLRQYPHT